MGNAFDRIGLPVGIVVHRVNTPFVARTVMFRMKNTIHNRIPQQHVGMGHIDLCTEYFLAVGKLPGPHAGKQV